MTEATPPTPSQAEGGPEDADGEPQDRSEARGHREVPRTTPSQAEGDDPDDDAPTGSAG